MACLLNFATRDGGAETPQQTVSTTTVSSFRIDGASGSSESDVMIRTFRTSTPRTPAAAPRTDRPPRISSRRVLPMDTPQPRAVRSSPPAAALGAPPASAGDSDDTKCGDLPDIPDTPASPSISDITLHRLVFLYICKYFLDFIMHNIFMLLMIFFKFF